MVFDIGGIKGRIPAKATVNSRSEEDQTLELSDWSGHGVVEEIWTRWMHLGDGWVDEGIIPIFSLVKKYKCKRM